MSINIDEIWSEVSNKIDIITSTPSYEEKDATFVEKVSHFKNTFESVRLEEDVEIMLAQVNRIHIIVNVIQDEKYLTPRDYTESERILIEGLKEDFEILSKVIRNRIVELTSEKTKTRSKRKLPKKEISTEEVVVVPKDRVPNKKR